MKYLALVGDSILDNSPYTAPHPDTASHLQAALGKEWAVDLLARDGATMADLRFQLPHLHAPTDTIVLSVGGNDAIGHIGLLEQPASSSTEVLAEMATMAEGFAREYRQILMTWRPLARRLIACTIYEPPLSSPQMARLAQVPLSLLNDRICREASRAGVDILDLRTVCTVPTDFVKEIELSPTGARKIATVLAALVLDRPTRPATQLFAV
jgi:lysophospholipase L1-like esterase